jgi:hypothetical protein
VSTTSPPSKRLSFCSERWYLVESFFKDTHPLLLLVFFFIALTTTLFTPLLTLAVGDFAPD